MESNEESEKLQQHQLQLDNEEQFSKEDMTCGYGPFRSEFLQKFATKRSYIFVYSILGFFTTSAWAYYNGTINTMEKRFKIPSKTLGYMNVATNASQLFMSTVLSYWAGRGHRPRWIAFSVLMFILQMILTLLPHIIYGPGEDALALTEEYGGSLLPNVSKATKLGLCGEGEHCVENKGSWIQPAILFVSRFVGGLGGGLFYTAGVAYIDDNVNKSESPFLISLSFFIRMMGPSFGFAVASFSLKTYISPFLTPMITSNDPRWIGAWWLGWVVFIVIIGLLTFPMSLFPKILPETAAKKRAQSYLEKREPPPSFKDMLETTKRLLKNRVFIYNAAASILYILGETPYWIYLGKYIETQYQQNASTSNLITGTVSLSTSAIGLLLSGIIIGRIRPSARSLSAWNVFVGIITVTGSVAYIFISCNTHTDVQPNSNRSLSLECNLECNCQHASYAPVCSENNEMFVSPCHAGCHQEQIVNNSKVYFDCSCINNGQGTARDGPCSSDCSGPLRMFLIILVIVNLASSSGVSSNFLVGVRCIDEKDKSASMGLMLTLMGILGFGPAPIIYGYLIDTTCIFWGKTCEGTGNCWLYNSSQLAYVLNLTAAIFIGLGSFFDWLVWYHSKELKIFD